MAEKISISEIYNSSEIFPPYVNMAYDIQNYSNYFCDHQTYNLPGVYLSNLLIYNLNKLESTLSIGQGSGYITGDLKHLFLYNNNGNEDSFVNDSNINFYRYLNKKTTGFIDSLFYDTSIDCTRCNLPLYTENTQNKKLIKIDNNFKVVPFPFFYPRPIDCILIKLRTDSCYTLSLHDSNKMSFNDPSLTLNGVSYSKADKNNYRVLAQNNGLIYFAEPTSYDYGKLLYSKIGFTKHYNIYYSDDKIYCNFYFYLLNNFLPDNSPYVNTSSHPMGTHYDGPSILSGHDYIEPGMNFQLIHERKFILSNDNCVYITGNSLLSYVSSALGSNYTDIHVYFTEINKVANQNWFYPREGGAVGTIAKFLSINSASARGSEAHRFNNNMYNEYTHINVDYNGNDVTYTSMFIVAVAKNTISQKYQLILVGIFTLNNLIYKISSNVSTSSLDTYPIKTLKPSEAMNIYKYPVISEDNYGHIPVSLQFFNDAQFYLVSTDIGGCSYYYEDDGSTPTVCKIARRELTLSSVLWKYGHYTDNVDYGSLGVNNYIFSCMTTIPFYEFNFNAYEYGESYGYSY